MAKASKKTTLAPMVSVSKRRAGSDIDPRTVKRRAQKILLKMGYHDAELSVVLCDDDFIHELNRNYRHKDKATDVLSFPMFETEELESMESPMLGDVIISIPTARRQAAQLQSSLLQEVTSLLIHGVLHLIGYDHQRPADESKMHQKARDLESLFR